MIDVLHIYYEGDVVGYLHYDRSSDSLTLTYARSWYDQPQFFPASLSLRQRTNEDAPVRTFLWGLLPDNPSVLEAWGKSFHVSPRNPFDLLKHVGEDCAGALQLIRPHRIERILSGELDRLTPLTKKQVKGRLDKLLSQSSSRPIRTEGRFSLAGAQRKDALQLIGRKWHHPEGRHPTTHIIKPQIEFDHHSLNEHFCLTLARLSGLPVPSTSLLDFGEFHALVVKRYDRQPGDNGSYTRIHQEDFCQALAIHPSLKYENEGGPSVSQIIRILRQFSMTASHDIDNFIRALALNWVVLGTDAHAKNYSLLIAPQSTFRLAPFYDIASFLPYLEPNQRKIDFAMKYGSKYRDSYLGLEQWLGMATKAQLPPKQVLTIVTTYLENLQSALPKAYRAVGKKHDCAFLTALYQSITQRLERCQSRLIEK